MDHNNVIMKKNSNHYQNDDNDNDNVNVNSMDKNMTTTHRRPIMAHPTAKAFFDELDKNQTQNSKSKSTTTTNQFIQRKSQSLGWRNRYSQEDWYPITLDISSSSSICTNDNNTNTTTTTTTTNISFVVQQIQCGEVNGTYGTGATVWPAATVLVKYLECHAKTLLQGKHIVDLGSGTGITSIASAWLGASHVICTDGESLVVQLARDNIQKQQEQQQEQEQQQVVKEEMKVNEVEEEAVNVQNIPKDTTTTTNNTNPSFSSSTSPKEDNNGPMSNNGNTITTHIVANCPIVVKQYWWGTGTCHEGVKIQSNNDETKEVVDIILVADCVLPKLYPIGPLVDAIDELLPPSSPPSSPQCHDEGENDNATSSSPTSSSPPAMAILSYEHRYYPDYDPRDKFQELATAKDLIVEIVPMNEFHPIYYVDDIEIWKVYRRRHRHHHDASSSCRQ